MSLDVHSRLAAGAGAVAAGGLAGVAGTAVTVLATRLEKPFAIGRPPGQRPRWEYGAVFGAVRGALGIAGLGAPAAMAAHLAAVWGSDQLVLPPPGAPSSSWTWRRRDMAEDFVRCVVYATVTQATYQWLKNRGPHR